ncbi:hypothetical protein [Haloarcula nitratireducens]|uniref:hypothetical protein n=1 Tax=Haloarcula nitratireducens TaxID=2487749 RepID=UPI001C73A15A|nr:hypothetical protein [Halomicroarcula nitratireducens]
MELIGATVHVLTLVDEWALGLDVGSVSGRDYEPVMMEAIEKLIITPFSDRTVPKPSD